MNVLQYLWNPLGGYTLMKTVFEDIVAKNSKKFIFKVQQMDDGSYEVIHQAFRVFEDGGSALKSEKRWKYLTLSSLREGEYKTSRQGKLFIDDQFWVNKTI